MSESQDVFQVIELHSIAYTCEKCGNELSFRGDTDATFAAPDKCPVCDLALGIRKLFEAYRQLVTLAGYHKNVVIRAKKTTPEQ